ncbi:S8 family serine peptidase [Ornithinimicrobium cavernae]|uniref:S8 family serine peptidase n=1 Tax=Ornithinimicrobium cavernae TaxID=2666047 RepID=UPI00192A5FA2|nr:S8 family serine peptidase [Ornithinimicrobium cavernae]
MTGASAEPALPQAEVGANKVKEEVTAQLEEKGATDFWVRFDARPDMSQFTTIDDWDARGKAVYSALTDTAEASQKEIRAQLDADGVEYKAYWATNAIRIQGGDQDLVLSLASDTGVEGIYPTTTYDAPELEKGEPEMAPSAVEWGVADINADDVWSTYGVHGEGIVVGNIDTGVQYDHPALVNQYRGNNGDGTFTHDYNWFDAAGSSPDRPADNNGHGTHTMGTMVGDDGGENKVGVAPGATWIAANGCCPTDQALIDSAQWMLAPTDLNGENPDTSKRPHIINNSWGTTLPSNDPFMEDLIEDWDAMGIFSLWANGNSGPACNTSGAPGSRIITYSVGNYNSSHTISNTSGKGYGQDGEIKPNIAAPGSNVRSTVPGNGYANYSGTSMAAPHAAGAVALLWSAAPGLVGDIAGTRALLDGTAIDTENLICGGTAADNNVFGEGRLDALALIEAAPTGDTGTLNGAVTDAGTGDALAGASVEVVGPINRSLVTGDAGDYSVLLVAGDYTVTASKFGYGTETVNATVTADGTVTVDFALDASPSATVSGTVTDGSGHGWPLYTKVTAAGTGVNAYTDPATGEYSLNLPTGATYTLEFVAQYPGYTTTTTEVTVDGAMTHDEQILVDVETCTAPGYSYVVEGVTESFDGTEVPAGWQVIDHADTGDVWAFNNPKNRDNLTGGEGNFAILDSDYYGSSGAQDTSLVSPSIDMSALTAPAVGFKQDWRGLGDDLADVDVSIDGGQTWTTVLSQDLSVRGPNEQFLQLPMAAGQSDVQVRFHGHLMEYDWWWEVDDVFVGNRDCMPTVAGGYVVGTVSGADTGEGIVGATVTSVGAPEETGTTVATPDNDNLDDGFYWIFSTLTGAHDFEATARNHESQTQSIDVAADGAVRADFTLGSGFVEIDPTAITTYLELGDSVGDTLTLTNTGSGAAEVQLSEVGGDFEILRADGTKELMSEMHETEGAPLQEIKAEVSFAQQSTSSMSTADESDRGAAEAPWTDLPQLGSTNMDGRAVSLDGTWYLIGGGSGSASYDTVQRYDAEAMAWTPVASLPSARNAVTAGVVNGQIVVSGGWVSSGTTAQTLVYDDGADSWTPVADNPSAVSAAGQAVADGRLYSVGGCTTSSCTPMSNAVTAYDPASDTWETLADYPVAVAFASCAGIDGEVYCTGGNSGAGGVADSYVYSPDANSWTAIADAPVDTWASQYAGANGMLIVNGGVQGGTITNATFAYDPSQDAWVDLPNSNTAVYRGAAACGLGKFGGSSGNFNATRDAEHLPGFDECGAGGADITWLSLSATELTIPAGESVTVDVTTDGNVAQPGVYTAGIRVSTNTPQSFDAIPVTMNVSPPRAWGKVMGNVSGADCDGATVAIDGATVDITPKRGGHAGWVLATDSEGGYATWVNTQNTKGGVQIIAAKDGWRPQFADTNPMRGGVRTVNFTLPKVGC